jgi:hypothetical protein
MKRLPLLFLFAVFALPGLACSLSAPTRQSEPLPPKITQEVVVRELTNTPILTETVVPQPAFEAKTYRDDEAGFEFDYPAGWAFDPGEHQSRGYYVQFYSWDWQPGEIVEKTPVGESILSVTVNYWDPKNNLEAFVNQRKLAWDSSGIAILSEEHLILTEDRSAAQLTTQGIDGMQSYWLITTLGEQYLTLSGSGDLGLLANIAHTVRPIQ